MDKEHNSFLIVTILDKIANIKAAKILRFNDLTTDGDLCHQGRDTEITPKKLRLSKPIDMRRTITDGAIAFSFQPFMGEKCFFWIFLRKTLVFNFLRGDPTKGII
jgi:hypothetical protein